jgi:hypothetical protein
MQQRETRDGDDPNHDQVTYAAPVYRWQVLGSEVVRELYDAQ